MFTRKVVVAVIALSLVCITPAEGKNIAHKQDAKDYAKSYMNQKYGWNQVQFKCTEKVFEYESHWIKPKCSNPS